MAEVNKNFDKKIIERTKKIVELSHEDLIQAYLDLYKISLKKTKLIEMIGRDLT